MRSHYQVLAIIFRTTAVAILLYGLFTFCTSLALGAGVAPSASGLFVRLIVVHVLAAVALWIISKPVAAFIVKGVD